MVKKITAGCLIAIFVPLFIILIFGFTAKKTVLNPNFFKNKLSQEEIYTKIISHGMSFFTKSMMGSDTPIIGSDTLAIAIQSSVKPEWVKEQFNIFFDSLSNYLDGKTEIIEGKISLKELKEKLGASLESTASQSMDNLPECTPEQMEQLKSKDMKNLSNMKIDCIPPQQGGNFKKELSKITSGSFILEIIPDELDLKGFAEKNQKEFDLLKKIHSYISIGIYIFLFVNLMILLFIGLLIYKPLSSVLRWMATALIIPSGLILIISLIGLFSSGIIVKNFILPPETTVQLVSLVVDILQNFIKGFLNYLIIYSSIPFVIAIAFYIIAYFQKKKEPIYSKEKLESKHKDIKKPKNT